MSAIVSIRRPRWSTPSRVAAAAIVLAAGRVSVAEAQDPAPEPGVAVPPEPAAQAAPVGATPAAAGGPAVAAAAATPAVTETASAAAEPEDAGAPGASAEDGIVVLVARIKRTTGSVHVVGEETLERYKYDEPHATLQLVPGIYVRTEDGFGLRPNIGIRGAISDRSSKVALMEDGVLF